MGADPISGLTGPTGLQIGRLADMQAFRAWQNDLGLSFEEIVAAGLPALERVADSLPGTFPDRVASPILDHARARMALLTAEVGAGLATPG